MSLGGFCYGDWVVPELQELHTMHLIYHHSGLVLKSPGRSQSLYFMYTKKARPDPTGPVHIGYISVWPVLTGLWTIYCMKKTNKTNQKSKKKIESTLQAGARKAGHEAEEGNISRK